MIIVSMPSLAYDKIDGFGDESFKRIKLGKAYIFFGGLIHAEIEKVGVSKPTFIMVTAAYVCGLLITLLGVLGYSIAYEYVTTNMLLLYVIFGGVGLSFVIDAIVAIICAIIVAKKIKK